MESVGNLCAAPFQICRRPQSLPRLWRHRYGVKLLEPVRRALAPIGATILERRQQELGADIGPLQAGGVPGFAPAVDTRHYFDYHHTAAVTLDKVDPENLRTQIATMAVLAYYLAELPHPLSRFSTTVK